MEDKIKKIENRINHLIKSAERYFEKYGYDNKLYETKIVQIEASLDILEILTGKYYTYNENGFYEITNNN